MARKSDIIAAPHDPTREKAAIQEFANSDLTPEQLRQRAPVLLNSNELLRNIPGLTPEEQTKFLDRVDQVCRSSFPKSLLTYHRKGISYYRLIQHKICNSLGERVQCNRATSNFSRSLGGARETWHHCCGVWRAYGHLARRVQWCPGSYQSLSHTPRQNFERGEGGKHAVTVGGLLSNEIYRFCGNGCRCGKGYPMKTSYRSAAST